MGIAPFIKRERCKEYDGLDIYVSVLSLLLTSAASSNVVCSVDPHSETPKVLNCPPSPTSSDVFEYTKNIMSQAGIQKLNEGESLMCSVDGIEIKDASGEKVQFVKSNVKLPGAVQTQVIQRTGEKESRVHIVTEDHKLIRFDPKTKAMDSVQLSEDFATTYADIRFGEDGRTILSSNHNGTQELEIDDLFKKATASLMPQSSQGESQAPDQVKPSAQQPTGPIQRFQPVNLSSTQDFKNLMVVDNDRGGILEFPILWSSSADSQGGTPKEGSVFISSAGDFAVTFGKEGKGRLWKDPTFYPFPRNADQLNAQPSNESESLAFIENSSIKKNALGKEGVVVDKALQLVKDILSLDSLVGGKTSNEVKTNESSLDLVNALDDSIHKFKQEAHLVSEESANDADPVVAAAVGELSKQLSSTSKKVIQGEGFKIVNGILVADNEALSANEPFDPSEFSQDQSSEATSSEKDSNVFSLDWMPWVFLLPERIRLAAIKRKRGFGQPV